MVEVNRREQEGTEGIMRRIWKWLCRIGGRRPVLDLPSQFGERMRIGAVRDAFRDEAHRETLRAVAQVLWMQRVDAAEEAMNAALDGKTDTKFHLGQMAAIDNALAEFAALMDKREGAEVTGQLKKWFLE